MIYKITFKKKGKIEEIQDFSFSRKDRCERHYWQWCKDRGYELIRVSNIRQYRRCKDEIQNVHS